MAISSFLGLADSNSFSQDTLWDEERKEALKAP